MDGGTIKILSQMSIAFAAGVEAAKCNIPISQSAIRSLLPGTPQYDDFLAGYDSQKKSLTNNK